MTWVCPYCGQQNYREPVNGRDTVRCTRCEKNKSTPEEAIKDREQAIENLIAAAKVLGDLTGNADLCSAVNESERLIREEIRELEYVPVYRHPPRPSSQTNITGRGWPWP